MAYENLLLEDEPPILHKYRVWPDGTVQLEDDGELYHWMSDDFEVVWAEDEDDALRKSRNVN